MVRMGLSNVSTEEWKLRIIHPSVSRGPSGDLKTVTVKKIPSDGTSTITALHNVNVTATGTTKTQTIAETVAGAALIACASYIAINESFANWQAVWFCAAVVGLSVILLRAQDVPDSK